MKKLDVVNYALAMLGKGCVLSLDDEEVGGEMKLMWPSAVEYVVQEVKPLWARRVAVLSGVEDDRMEGVKMSAVLPEGCVDVVDVRGVGWMVFDGRVFWGCGEDAVVTFLVRPDEDAEWCCADGELLGMKLAHLCAFAVTGSTKLQEKLEGNVMRLLIRAQYRARMQDMGRGGRSRVASDWGRRGIV